jgi:molybdate transport system substrate-binding protein
MTTAIAGISSMATRAILGDLAQRYEATHGAPLQIASMGGVDAARLIRAGEATDLVVLASTVMTQLEAEGRLVAGSIRGFALSGMAIAVPSGAAWPDIHDEAAVQRAVQAAGRIGYSTGPSGDHLLGLCQRWGVLPAQADRLIKAPPGVPVGSLVARGEADLGFQQLSEFIDVPGIEIVGPLPPAIQAVTLFAVGVCAQSSRPAQAADAIAFLTSADADDAKRRRGMDPAPA